MKSKYPTMRQEDVYGSVITKEKLRIIRRSENIPITDSAGNSGYAGTRYREVLQRLHIVGKSTVWIDIPVEDGETFYGY